MAKIILSAVTVTCDDLTSLLGLPVLEITTGADAEVTVRVQATTEEITDTHKSVLADVFSGKVVSLEVD